MAEDYRDYIILKRVELPTEEKYHGLSRDDAYDTVCTDEGLGMALGAVPMTEEEAEFVYELPQVEEVFEDKTLAFPEPVDALGARSPELAVENVDFHRVRQEAWKRTKGKGARVAVLDTGLDSTHAGITFRQNNPTLFNLTRSDTANDRQGHGTHCMGTVCGPSNIGVAPEAELVSIKVLGDDGSGWYSWIIAGLERAVQEGCHVASLSLGGPGKKESVLNMAINAASRRGVNVVAAAGNEQRGSRDRLADRSNPASARGATTVGAVDILEGMAPFSNIGYCVDLVALGVGVEGLGLGGTVGRRMSGTSMACPFVAGAAALLRSVGLSAAATKKRLYAAARKTKAPAVREGHGILSLENIFSERIAQT